MLTELFGKSFLIMSAENKDTTTTTPVASPAHSGNDSDSESYVKGSLFMQRKLEKSDSASSSSTVLLEESTCSTSGYLKRKAYEEIPRLQSKKHCFEKNYLLVDNDKFDASLIPSSQYFIKNNKTDDASLSICAQLCGTKKIKEKAGHRFRLFSGREDEMKIVSDVNMWTGFPERRGYTCSASCWAIPSQPFDGNQMKHFIKNIYEALRPTRIALKTVKWKDDEKTVCELEWYSDAEKCPRWLETLQQQETVSIMLPKYLQGETGWRQCPSNSKLYVYDLCFKELVRCTFKISPPTQTLIYTFKWPSPPSDRYYNVDDLEVKPKLVRTSRYDAMW